MQYEEHYLQYAAVYILEVTHYKGASVISHYKLYENLGGHAHMSEEADFQTACNR